VKDEEAVKRFLWDISEWIKNEAPWTGYDYAAFCRVQDVAATAMRFDEAVEEEATALDIHRLEEEVFKAIALLKESSQEAIKARSKRYVKP